MTISEYEPSGWMTQAFGDRSRDAASCIVQAAHSAQSDSSDAKAGSRLKTNEAYGATFWLALAKSAAARLEELGAEVVLPKGSRYRVAIVNRTLILTVKLPVSVPGVDAFRMTSAVRQRILDLSGTSNPLVPTLDFGPDFELLDDEGNAVVEGEFGSAERAVLVVVEGTAKGGVERIHIGDVRLGDFNKLVWLHREELPVSLTDERATGLVALDSNPSSSFASADIPQADLGLVAQDGIAENDLAENEVKDAGNEGAETGGA